MKKVLTEIEKLDNESAYLKNQPIRAKEQMSSPLVCENVDPEHMERLKKFVLSTTYVGGINLLPKEQESYNKNFILRDRLLTFGGEQVVMPFIEEDFENIMERGQLWYGDRIKMIKGRPSQCHSNSAELWENNRNNPDVTFHIATGYALSADGLWRQHTWGVLVKARKNLIVETTEKRLAYFGFTMTEKEAEFFAEENY